jgi:hypothetical protein
MFMKLEDGNCLYQANTGIVFKRDRPTTIRMMGLESGREGRGL